MLAEFTERVVMCLCSKLCVHSRYIMMRMAAFHTMLLCKYAHTHRQLTHFTAWSPHTHTIYSASGAQTPEGGGGCEGSSRSSSAWRVYITYTHARIHTSVWEMHTVGACGVSSGYRRERVVARIVCIDDKMRGAIHKYTYTHNR